MIIMTSVLSSAPKFVFVIIPATLPAAVRPFVASSPWLIVIIVYRVVPVIVPAVHVSGSGISAVTIISTITLAILIVKVAS